ncbi:MAG: glycosyltransferase family 4 protein [Bacteroidetes bacterium]|nr:glycosyltransferase family 4 protein [Bacteroidota bacterium]
MRILQLVTRRQYRGAEMSAFFLSKQLLEEGHEIFWVGLYKTKDNILELPGAFNADLSGNKSGFINKEKVRSLKKIIKEKNIDIIQCNGSDTLKYVVAAQLFDRKVPFVYRNISKISFWLKKSFIKKILTGFLLSKSSAIVSVGVKSKEDVLSIFPKLVNKISVISRGVPSLKIDGIEKRAQIIQEFGINKSNKILLWAGSFSFEKNPAFMLDVMQFVDENAILIMAGNGILIDEIKDLLHQRNLQNRIIIAGYRNDLQDLLSAADLFLLGSKIEGVPGVILEAAVQEVPSVAVAVGGVEEVVINNKTGIILQDHDSKKFASSVNMLLQNENLRMEMGKNARHFVLKNFNEKNNALRFIELYKKITDKN